MGTVHKFRRKKKRAPTKRNERQRALRRSIATGAFLLLYAFASIKFFGGEKADPNAEIIEGRVTRIVDGDSIVVSGVEIRLGDFSAPEWNEPGGREATRALKSIASGKRVICKRCEGARVPGRCTSYDRVIATCRLHGKRLGDMMRDQGILEGGR